MCREYPREFESEANSRFSYEECEHADTHYVVEHIQEPRSIKRKMKDGGMPKRETLSGLLQGYESQTERFRDHLNFSKFCKIKMREASRRIDFFYLLLMVHLHVQPKLGWRN